jgi:hypothetical protein
MSLCRRRMMSPYYEPMFNSTRQGLAVQPAYETASWLQVSNETHTVVPDHRTPWKWHHPQRIIMSYDERKLSSVSGCNRENDCRNTSTPQKLRNSSLSIQRLSPNLTEHKKKKRPEPIKPWRTVFLRIPWHQPVCKEAWHTFLAYNYHILHNYAYINRMPKRMMLPCENPVTFAQKDCPFDDPGSNPVEVPVPTAHLQNECPLAASESIGSFVTGKAPRGEHRGQRPGGAVHRIRDLRQWRMTAVEHRTLTQLTFKYVERTGVFFCVDSLLWNLSFRVMCEQDDRP